MRIRLCKCLLGYRFLATGLLLSAAGCGGGSEHGVDLHPVHGVITQAGQPVEGARVSLYQVGASGVQATGLPVPKGTTDAQGAFEIRTFDPGDGAPAGKYSLTVSLLEQVEAPDGQLLERDRLQDKYANPAHPVMEVEVPVASNDLGEIDLP